MSEITGFLKCGMLLCAVRTYHYVTRHCHNRCQNFHCFIQFHLVAYTRLSVAELVVQLSPVGFMLLVALGHGLDDRGSRVRFPARAGNFSLHHRVQKSLGPTQPRIQWVPGALSLWVKRPGREADHLPPSSADVKECYTSTSQIPLHGVVLS
jgi:hypothetical protein